jgi:ribosomal protein L19
VSASSEISTTKGIEMITMTQNLPNKSITVSKTVLHYGVEKSIHLTYLNTERAWPVRSNALEYVDSILYARPDCELSNLLY